MAINQVQFQKGLSMAEFLDQYGTEEKCHAAVVAWRWPEDFRCPGCGDPRHTTFVRDGRQYLSEARGLRSYLVNGVLPDVPGTRSCYCAAQAQHQGHRISRRNLQAVVLVERLGTVMEGMNQQCPHSRVLRYDQRPVDGVLQQCAPKLDPLRATINRQSCQHHDRYRLRHVSPHASRGHLVRNRAGCHRIVAVNTAILICDNERAAGASSLVGYRPAPQPVIQHLLAAGKFIKAMRRGQRLWRCKRKAHSLSHGAFKANNRSRPGLGLGGASSRARNCWNLSASRVKWI